jgi:restriction system protein
MRPILELASDGKEHSLVDAREELARKFNLTEEEKNLPLPSGKQRRFANRVAWARVYLGQAGALINPRRGHFQITDRGRDVLKQTPQRITIKDLERFPEFVEFRAPKARAEDDSDTAHPESETPEELLETAYVRFRNNIASELLRLVKASSPRFFERLVVELLLNMGYGGSRREAGEAIGKAGDEGIDGIINEDRLGLDVIYIQAKKWEGSVGRPRGSEVCWRPARQES